MQNDISPNARIGKNVQIGHGTRIFDSAEIGDDTVIGDFCLVGIPLKGSSATTRIGPGSVVRSHAVIYQDIDVGPRFETGHHVLVRDGVRAGVNLRVGSYSSLEGKCRIGDYCRIHGYVQVTRATTIGHFVWIFSWTPLTADPLPPSHVELPLTVEDGVVICVSCTIMPGATLRKGAFICANSCARGEVPPGAVVDGREGDIIAHVSQLSSRKFGLTHPWMGHFADAYPPEAQERIRALEREIMAEIPLYEEARARRKPRRR